MPNYPHAHNFRLDAVRNDLLNQHRFPDELDQPFFNRIMERLIWSLDKGTLYPRWTLDIRQNQLVITADRLLASYPVTQIDTHKFRVAVGEESCVWNGYTFSPKTHCYSVRVSDLVNNLIERHLPHTRRGATQQAIEHLIEWAVQMPIISPLQSAAEAMGCLRQFSNQRIPAGEVKDILTRFCSDAWCDRFLEELNEQGKLQFIRLGPGAFINGKQVTDIQF